MPAAIPEIQPPLVSAFFTSMQLLHEEADLAVQEVDELRKKGAAQLSAKIEQQWTLQATMGGDDDSGKPILLIHVTLTVNVTHQDSGVYLGTYKNISRASFDVIGMIGKMNSEEIPTNAIAPYLAYAADRVRVRCNNNFGVMNLPVRIPAPRDFTTVPPASNQDTAAEANTVARRKKKKVKA